MKEVREKWTFDLILNFSWLFMIITLTFIHIFFKEVDYFLFIIPALFVWIDLKDMFNMKWK